MVLQHLIVESLTVGELPDPVVIGRVPPQLVKCLGQSLVGRNDYLGHSCLSLLQQNLSFLRLDLELGDPGLEMSVERVVLDRLIGEGLGLLDHLVEHEPRWHDADLLSVKKTFDCLIEEGTEAPEPGHVVLGTPFVLDLVGREHEIRQARVDAAHLIDGVVVEQEFVRALSVEHEPLQDVVRQLF